MASKEVQDATGEAPSAAEQLAEKRATLDAALAQLDAAELAMDTHRVIALEHEVAVLTRHVERLAASAAVERTAEAKVEAADLAAALREKYADALAKLMPDIEQARLAIRAVTDSVRKCSRTWNAAMRAEYDLKLLHMRFRVEGAPLDVLPLSPVAALQMFFAEEIDRFDGESRTAALPVALVIASDTPDQVAVKEMAAAADFVLSGADPKLSKDVLALCARAGPVSVAASTRVLPPRDDDAFIGPKPMPLPAGAVQSAVGPLAMNEPLTEREQQANEEIRRRNARKQAAVGREVADAAKAEIARRELLQQGPLKPLKGR